MKGGSAPVGVGQGLASQHPAGPRETQGEMEPPWGVRPCAGAETPGEQALAPIQGPAGEGAGEAATTHKDNGEVVQAQNAQEAPSGPQGWNEWVLGPKWSERRLNR